jgi:hypothetical protein
VCQASVHTPSGGVPSGAQLLRAAAELRALVVPISAPKTKIKAGIGLVAPAGTPASIIKTLNDTLSEGMKSAEIQRLIANLGSEWKPNSPEEFAAYIALHHRKWVEVGEAAGVKID